MVEVVIIQITDASDGNGFGPAPGTVLTRNDMYLEVKLATQFAYWSPGIQYDETKVYRFSSLPRGYSGYERARDPPKEHHIDRYLYGHPGGRFQSFKEALPHLLYLHVHGTHAGCYCAMCQYGRPGMNTGTIDDAWHRARDDVMGKKSKKRKRDADLEEDMVGQRSEGNLNSTQDGPGSGGQLAPLPQPSHKAANVRPVNKALIVANFYFLAYSYKEEFTKTACIDAAWASFFWTYGLQFWQALPPDTRHTFLHQIYELCHQPHLPAAVRAPMYKTFAKLQEREWDTVPQFTIVGPGRRILETAKDDLLRTLPLDNGDHVFRMMDYVAHAARFGLAAVKEKGENTVVVAEKALTGGAVKEEKLLFACLLSALRSLR